MTGVLQGIFAALKVGVENFGDVLATAFKTVANVFWDNETGLTFIGTIMLITLAISVVLWGFNFVQKIIHRKSVK